MTGPDDDNGRRLKVAVKEAANLRRPQRLSCECHVECDASDTCVRYPVSAIGTRGIILTPDYPNLALPAGNAKLIVKFSKIVAHSTVNEVTECFSRRESNIQATCVEPPQALRISGVHVPLKVSQRFDLKRSCFAANAIECRCPVEPKLVDLVDLPFERGWGAERFELISGIDRLDLADQDFGTRLRQRCRQSIGRPGEIEEVVGDGEYRAARRTSEAWEDLLSVIGSWKARMFPPGRTLGFVGRCASRTGAGRPSEMIT